MVLVKNLKFFHVFIFVKINQQNVLDVILESKKAFLDYKKQKVKKVKKCKIFSSFYCRLNKPGKCFCRYSRKEKGVFGL